MKWITGTIIALILGTVLQLGFLVYAMYVLLGILILSHLLTHQWMGAIAVHRQLIANKAEIGDSETLILDLTNESSLAIPWLIFEESFPRTAMEQSPPKITLKGKGLGIIQLGPGKTHRIEYTITFKQRGYYQLGPLLVETGDLFGLHRKFKLLTEPQFVLVVPKIVPLLHYQIASKRPIGEIRITHRLFDDPTRIAAVRPYQAGDPLNQIHWRATARTGELHSRIYENSCVAGATLLLDFHDFAYQGSGETVASELAITTAASLANALFEEGHQVGLVTNGRDAAERIKHEGWKGEFTTRDGAHQKTRETTSNERLKPIVVPTRKGADQITTILETLGRLETSKGLEFCKLIQESAHFLPRDATVIPILRDISPEAALALGMLRQRGYAVTVVLIQFDEGYSPQWAKAPSWAEPIIAQGLEFVTISNEDELAALSTLALV
jgi:uncharacterized protein (DUF58 family)